MTKRKLDLRESLTTVIPFLALVVTIWSVWSSVGELRNNESERRDDPSLAELQRQVERTSGQLSQLQFAANKAGQSTVGQVELNRSLKELSDRLQRIEATLGQEPQRAADLVVLRKDLDAATREAAIRNDWARADIQRIETLLNGLIIGVVLAIFGLILNSLQDRFRKKQSNTDDV